MDKRISIISKILHTVICIVVLGVLIANKGKFNYVVSSGTGIDMDFDGEYEFTPMLDTENDTIIQTFKPDKSNLQSLEIRMANEHPDEIESKVSFVITDMHRNEIWADTVNSENIENWRYYSLDTGEIFQKDEEYLLKIKCKNYVNGISYKIFICNNELFENRNLTFNGQKLSGGLDIIYNYRVFPFRYFCFMVVLCILAIMILWFKGKAVFPINAFITLPMISGLYLWIIEHLSNNSITNMSVGAIVINILLIMSFLFWGMALFNTTGITVKVIGMFVLILGLVNHYVLLFRQTVVLPSDIYSIRTAVEVSPNYILDIDKNILEVLVALIFIISLLYRTDSKNKKSGRRITVGIAASFTIIVLFISVNDDFENKIGVDVHQFNQTGRSKEIGLLLNLIENVKYLYVSKPEGYSKDKVQQIYENVEVKDKTDIQELPDIIVVMNESFADLKMLGEMETTSDYLPNFTSVASERNSKAGTCVVSVFGGGTSCSEFEFLTGGTMLFLPSGIAPYQQYIHSNIDALPSYLKSINYNTYAIHAANPKSWNRDVAYPLIGFERFINSNDEEFKDASYCRYWIDDQSMVNVVENLYHEKESENLFEFGITIQCHGGYDYENFPVTVELKHGLEQYEDVSQYLTLIQATDEAYGNLINDLKNTEKPTIVLMFGDHLPALSESFYSEIFGNSQESYTYEEMIKMHSTPYIFWANYDVDFSDIPDTISSNFLAVYLLKAAGIQLDDYYSYLYSLSQKYPVISRSGVVNSDGDIVSYAKSEECYEEIHDYEIIQYS